MFQRVLVCPLQGPPLPKIPHLGPIKGAIARTQLPGLPKIPQAPLQLLQGQVGRVRGAQCRWDTIQAASSHLLCMIPSFGVPQESIGTGGQGQAEGKAQDGVNSPDEIQRGIDLTLQLGKGCQGCRCDTLWGGQGRVRGTDTCSSVQKMWASSCWKRRTRVSPVRVPGGSFRCTTPKSARRRGSSRHERGRWANIRLRTDRQTDSAPRSIPRHPRDTQLTSGPGSSWV